MNKTDEIKNRLHEIIFESDTFLGKFFDVALFVLIILSIGIVFLDSIVPIHKEYENLLLILEWVVTILFTIEYILRIWVLKKPWRYIFSFYGVIDFLSIVPTYLSVFFAGTHFLAAIKIMRLFRVFRVFKLSRYIKESNLLAASLRASIRRIIVFISFIFFTVVVIGSMMYVIEGEEAGFTSIPTGIYWAIVTITTVGYGDISPITPLGQFLASLVMLLGYGVLAIPTGIVSAEMISQAKKGESFKITTQACPSCGGEGHASDAKYCKFCGHKL
ncbi:MAG: ion transporter [Flavobacteriales bacterium]